MAQYEVTLRDYWRILRRRKGIVLFTGFLLGFFSFVMAHTIGKEVPKFEAAAKVQIGSNQSLESLYLQTLSYSGGGDQLETQQAIITSFPVLKRVGRELGLFSDGAVDTARVVLGLQDIISTSQDGYTNIVVIGSTHTDPFMAKALANTVAKAYREYDYDENKKQAAKQRRFIENQRAKVRLALERAEEAVKVYRQEKDLISLSAQAGVMLGQVTQTERALQVLEQNRRVIDAMLKEIEREAGLSEKTLQGVSRDQVGESFMMFTQQLNTLRLERDGLLVQYTEGHPRVRQVQAKIDQLIRKLVEELRQRSRVIVQGLSAERARLDTLRSQYNELPSRGLQLDRLEREMILQGGVAAELEQQYQKALIREAEQVEEVVILQEAITPIEPVNPHQPLKRAFMGVALGLILGIVFAVVAETLDTSIGTIEDVQEYIGAQVVGIIPFINVDDVRASLRRRGVTRDDDRTVERKAQLVAFFDPQSTLAENYRTLRTNIEFVTVEKGAKCLLMTSSMHKEGKSTTISNLAMTMAQLGKQTLLIDCDLRRPSLPRLFGLDKEPGLTEVIVGNYQWRDIVRTVTDIVTGGMGMEDIIQTQGISNLHIITSGSIPPNPAELLNSQKMTNFIAEVSQAYDMVLFDTPPLLHVTDAAILGKKVDGALMVYKAGDIPRTSLKRSTNLLKSVQIDLLGIILNGIRAEISSDFQDLSYYSMIKFFWLDKWRGRPRRIGVAESDEETRDLASAQSFLVSPPDQLPCG